MHLTTYNAFGTAHYDRVKNILHNTKGANMNKNSVYLLPNITNVDQSIDIRGNTMAKHIERLCNKLGTRKCHLAAHSFTGIDARAAISLYGADKYV